MRVVKIGLLLGFATTAIAASAAEPTSTAALPDRQQETVCRKDRETGSLVRVKKTCHTRAQWQYIDAENQRFSDKFVNDNRGKPSGQ